MLSKEVVVESAPASAHNSAADRAGTSGADKETIEVLKVNLTAGKGRDVEVDEVVANLGAGTNGVPSANYRESVVQSCGRWSCDAVHLSAGPDDNAARR